MECFSSIGPYEGNVILLFDHHIVPGTFRLAITRQRMPALLMIIHPLQDFSIPPIERLVNLRLMRVVCSSIFRVTSIQSITTKLSIGSGLLSPSYVPIPQIQALVRHVSMSFNDLQFDHPSRLNPQTIRLDLVTANLVFRFLLKPSKRHRWNSSISFYCDRSIWSLFSPR